MNTLMPSPLTPLLLCKCLSDPNRLQLALLLAQVPERCVCELTDALQLSQPTVSRHLALLRNGGLLQDRRQGKWVYYRLHDALPDWAHAALAALAHGQPGTLPLTPTSACCA